jgi:hypothetical protein
MGRRRLVNSRSRRLEATHWRHSKYAADFTDGPADVGQGEVVTRRVPVCPSRCIFSLLRRRDANDITRTKHKRTQHFTTDCMLSNLWVNIANIFIITFVLIDCETPL